MRGHPNEHETMKVTPAITGTVIMLVLVLITAGCTGSVPADSPVSGPQVTTIPVSEVGTSPVTQPRQIPATIAPEAAANPGSARIFGKYTWVEYRENNTVTMPPNPRYQWAAIDKVEGLTENYLGTPAIYYRITRTMDYPEWTGDNLTHTKNGWIIVTNRYFDAATTSFLGGTSTDTIKGVKKPVKSIPPDTSFVREAGPSGELGITPFGEMNITLTYQGKESVTVPAGTYPAARKYTGTFRDGTPITFWVAQDIPVPVQYQFPNKYLDGINPFQSFELAGWG
jgi:hypothetical protein